jgi:hypothetical protein
MWYMNNHFYTILGSFKSRNVLSGRMRCPLEAHAACFPFNPFLYASIKWQKQAENLASMSELLDILILHNITFACFLKGQIQVLREHFTLNSHFLCHLEVSPKWASVVWPGSQILQVLKLVFGHCRCHTSKWFSQYWQGFSKDSPIVQQSVGIILELWEDVPEQG